MFPLVALGFLVTGIAAASSSSCIGTISSLDDAGESITLLANTRSNVCYRSGLAYCGRN
jgi:hypothetical protein